MAGGETDDAAGVADAASLEIVDPDDPGGHQVEAIGRACRSLGFSRIPFPSTASRRRARCGPAPTATTAP